MNLTVKKHLKTNLLPLIAHVKAAFDAVLHGIAVKFGTAAAQVHVAAAALFLSLIFDF